ncbi:MAG: flagellar biosynthesis protein FlhF, partial [Gammaproteobacteria bacterium]|nr:flagellar biosynthesis protein FlhF [Gammaproteobacteria bacterium]
YGRILDVPVRVVADQAELYSTLKEWSDKQLVLIDTAGMSQRDVRLSKQFNLLLGSDLRIKTYLVLSATTHIAGLDEAIRAFKAALPDACILTKLDEAASLGAVVSEVIKHRLAIAYLGDGQRVPEDLHTARAKNIVSHAVSLMQQGSDIFEEESRMLRAGGVQANAHV